jgi:hypothetical protein
MKKSVVGFMLFLIMLTRTMVAAASAVDIEAVISGKVEKGENIQIVINIKDIKSLYAGDIEFEYDPSVLKLKGIEIGDLISKPGLGKFDAINKVDGENGTARYAFSCLGQGNGFSGTGILIKINAEVLKKETISINSKPFLKAADSTYNLKLQLCDSGVKELEYTFKALNSDAEGNKPSDNQGSIDNSDTTGNTINGSTSNDTSKNNTNNNAANTASNNTASNPNTTDPQKAEENKSQLTVEQKPEVKLPSDNQQQNNAPNNSASKTAQLGKGNNNLTAIIGLLVIVLGTAGAYFIWKHKLNNKTNSSDNTKDFNV